MQHKGEKKDDRNMKRTAKQDKDKNEQVMSNEKQI